jgi:hypothetical protein
LTSEPPDTDTYLLMAGSDVYSQEIREELARRQIGFVEVDVAAGQGVVVPTLVVNTERGSHVRYAGYGRIKQEFLSRHP